MQGLKSAILAIFQKGPSRIPCWISKILFVLGSYEFLAMALSFRVQFGKITVCIQSLLFLYNIKYLCKYWLWYALYWLSSVIVKVYHIIGFFLKLKLQTGLFFLENPTVLEGNLKSHFFYKMCKLIHMEVRGGKIIIELSIYHRQRFRTFFLRTRPNWKYLPIFSHLYDFQFGRVFKKSKIEGTPILKLAMVKRL